MKSIFTRNSRVKKTNKKFFKNIFLYKINMIFLNTVKKNHNQSMFFHKKKQSSELNCTDFRTVRADYFLVNLEYSSAKLFVAQTHTAHEKRTIGIKIGDKAI